MLLCYKLLVNNFVLGLLSFVVAACFVFNKAKKEVYDFLCLFHAHTHTHASTHPCTCSTGDWTRASSILRNRFAELAKISLIFKFHLENKSHSVTQAVLTHYVAQEGLEVWPSYLNLQSRCGDRHVPPSPVCCLQCHSIVILTNWN